MTAATVQTVEEYTIPWWLVLLEGISLVILGFLLITSPGATTVVLVQFIGAYWLIGGIFKIVTIFMDSSLWGWKLFAGLLGIVAGIVVINHPLWSPIVIGSTIVILLGIQGLIYGGVSLFQAFRGAGWGVGILGIVSILFGIILLSNVMVATISLPWTIGALAIVGGASAIIMAFRLR